MLACHNMLLVIYSTCFFVRGPYFLLHFADVRSHKLSLSHYFWTLGLFHDSLHVIYRVSEVTVLHLHPALLLDNLFDLLKPLDILVHSVRIIRVLSFLIFFFHGMFWHHAQENWIKLALLDCPHTRWLLKAIEIIAA